MARPETELPEGLPTQGPGPDPYYVQYGRACDWIFRCKDCRRLVTGAVLTQVGTCPHCGNRRVYEVRVLSFWEWLRIRLGILDFPHRREFLAEFSRGIR